MKDLHNNISVTQLTDPAVATATVTSTETDMQGFNSMEIVFSIGESGDTLSGSVLWTLSLTESDSQGGPYTAVAAADVLGPSSIVIDDAAEDDSVHKIGYIGSKRYVKGVAAATGTHTNGTPIAVLALRSNAGNAPVA